MVRTGLASMSVRHLESTLQVDRLDENEVKASLHPPVYTSADQGRRPYSHENAAAIFSTSMLKSWGRPIVDLTRCKILDVVTTNIVVRLKG